MKEGGPGGFGAGRGRRAGVRSAFCLSDIFVVFGREARCSLWDKGGGSGCPQHSVPFIFKKFFLKDYAPSCLRVCLCVHQFDIKSVLTLTRDETLFKSKVSQDERDQWKYARQTVAGCVRTDMHSSEGCSGRTHAQTLVPVSAYI